MEKKFRIGILGLMRGRVPLITFNQLEEYAEVVGVVEKDEAIMEEVRNEGWLKPHTVVYNSFDEMIEDAGLDAVVLCDYFHTHYKYAIQALDAKIAVFSETTAAPSLGACVDLVEAVERNNGKYMLMANCCYFMALQQIKKTLAEGTDYGDLIYAEAEYVHPANFKEGKKYDAENLHWRGSLPSSCYYNMHSLGPLMYVTKSVPKKVLAKAAVMEHPLKFNNTPKTYVLTEMDNGALFNTTGCVGVGSVSKWYRFAFQQGSIETERLVESPEKLYCAGIEGSEAEEIVPTWDTCGALTPDEMEKYGEVVINGGHGGCDSVLYLDMIKYLRGEEEPFFDVYRSAALSATGILAWYSVLDGSRELEIPDFSRPEDRDKIRGDYRMPIADRLEDITLPCRVEEDKK